MIGPAFSFSVSGVSQQRANRNREQRHGDRDDYGFELHGALWVATKEYGDAPASLRARIRYA